MENKRKSYNLLIGIIALLAIVIFVAITGYIVSRPEPPVIQGQAEATEYRVSGKVPGRIEQFYASEGDFVRKGDTLVKIDSPEVKARLAQAFPYDIEGYCDGKDAFVRALEQRALSWREKHG